MCTTTMKPYLNIQQVAKLTGLNAYTLRYYEKIGLIDAVVRGDNGFRQFSEADLGWIDFLKRLRATGMKISQMLQVAALRRQGPVTIPERRVLLQIHKQKMIKQMSQLQENLQIIEDKIVFYQIMEDKE
ncbi:MAG: adhR 2 [Bacilli bacterium]|nr:adhR 2 [Bacilli bacterium]